MFLKQRTLFVVLVFSVGIFGQETQLYHDILQNAGKIMQNGGSSSKDINVSNLVKLLSQVDQKTVLQLATQALSQNDQNSTNVADIFSSLPGVMGLLSKLPNSNQILSDFLKSGISPSVLANATTLLSNILKSTGNMSSLMQDFGSGSAKLLDSTDGILSNLLKAANLPPQLLGTAKTILNLMETGKMKNASSLISKISNMVKPTQNNVSGYIHNPPEATATPQISELCKKHAQITIQAIQHGDIWAMKINWFSVVRYAALLSAPQVLVKQTTEDQLTLSSSLERKKFMSNIPEMREDLQQETSLTFLQNKLIDAMGKLPSKVFEGNLKWLGSYDECKRVEAYVKNEATNQTISPFSGKYCAIGVPVGDIIGGVIGNQGELAQMFAYLGLGLCVPDSCSKTDVMNAVNQVLPKIPLPGGKHLYAVYSNCQENDLEYDAKAKGAFAVCGIFIALMTLATAYDVIFIQWLKKKSKSGPAQNGILSAGTNKEFQYKPRSSEDHTQPQNGPVVVLTDPVVQQKPGIPARLLLAFSVYTNGKKLLNTSQSSGSITAINGIRFLSMTWVILGHTYAFIFNSSENFPTFGVELMNRWTFTAISNALISVDTFFTLSGLLMSYLVLKEMKKKNGARGINWGMFYFHRFWRLTPAYMLTLFVCVTTFRYWGDGPMWRQEGREKDYCEDTWWTNLLYISNIVKTKEMCFGHSWYLANDMQFYVLSPLLFIPLFYNEIIGVVVCGVFLLTTTITAGVVSSTNNLQPSTIGGGEKGVKHGDYMQDYYFKPWCRMGPYIIGILGGYIMYKTQCKIKMNKILNLCIWIVAAGASCAILYGLYGPLKGDHPLNNDVSALYNATHRSVWGVCVCWVIIACASGNGGYVNTLLSWKGLIPLSRLTYCAYLIHPYVMYLYYDSIRKTIHLNDLEGLYLFLGHLTLSYGVAFVLSLAFESPMMGLEKVIFGGKSNKSEKKPPPEEVPQVTTIDSGDGFIQNIVNNVKSDRSGSYNVKF